MCPCNRLKPYYLASVALTVRTLRLMRSCWWFLLHTCPNFWLCLFCLHLITSASQGLGSQYCALKALTVSKHVDAQAPVVQSGMQLDYWEASGRVAAARGGMEIQNHWGAVDSHVELTVSCCRYPRQHRLRMHYRPFGARRLA